MLQLVWLLLALALSYLLLRPSSPLPTGVPHVRGLPLLGSIVAFARSTTGFLRSCSEQHGPAWAARLLTARCLFLTSPSDFGAVWRRTDALSFHVVELEMNEKVLALGPQASAAAVDVHAHNLWTQHLSGAALPDVAAAMASHLLEQSSPEYGSDTSVLLGQAAGPGWCSAPLYDLIYRLLFHAGVRVVLGGSQSPSVLLEDFKAFDYAFPLLAAGVPPRLLRAGVAGRERLSSHMLQLQSDENSLSPLVRSRLAHFRARGLSEREAATLNGNLIWPLHANSAPAAFWAVAHVVACPEATAALLPELDAFMARHPGFPSGVVLSPSLLDKELPIASSCCLEALRLHSSSFGLRVATQSVDLPLSSGATAHIHPGTRVFLASTAHTDDTCFPDAKAFRFDRFLPVSSGGGGGAAKDVLAFGGGVSMCPGRHLAMVELRLVLLVMLHRWEVKMSDPLPPQNEQRAGLGVLPPIGDVTARLRLRRRDR